MFLKDFQLFPESAVLPLDDSPKDKKLYHIFLAITKRIESRENSSQTSLWKYSISPPLMAEDYGGGSNLPSPSPLEGEGLFVSIHFHEEPKR
jgi:hypothetical protein